MSIEPRKRNRDGRITYRVRLRDAGGREYVRTFPTKKAALSWEAQQLADRSRGLWIDPRLGETTFAEAATVWLASNPAKRGSSRARDMAVLRAHLLPAIGPRPLRSLGPRDLQTLINGWTRSHAPKTVRRHYEVLRAVLNHAVAAEMLGRSPARGIKLPAMVAARPPLVAGPADLAALADAVGPGYAPMVYLGAVLGLRWGECAGLRVGRLDFYERTIAIAEQRTRGEGGQMIDGPPKSVAGLRTLGAPAALMDLLGVHLVRRGLSAGDVGAHVFVGPEGQPLDYSHFRVRVWVPAAKAAGLAGFGFHDLRRTNATQLVLQKVDLKTAQSRLGHSDPRLTLAVYAQVVTEADRDAAERLGSALMGRLDVANTDDMGGSRRAHARAMTTG